MARKIIATLFSFFIHNHYEVHFLLLNVTKNYVSNRTDLSKILHGHFVAGKLEYFW